MISRQAQKEIRFIEGCGDDRGGAYSVIDLKGRSSKGSIAYVGWRPTGPNSMGSGTGKSYDDIEDVRALVRALRARGYRRDR